MMLINIFPKKKIRTLTRSSFKCERIKIPEKRPYALSACTAESTRFLFPEPTFTIPYTLTHG